MHLPHCRAGLPFTTIYSEVCDELAVMLRKAVEVGERRRENAGRQQRREVLLGCASADTSRQLFVLAAKNRKINQGKVSSMQHQEVPGAQARSSNIEVRASIEATMARFNAEDKAAAKFGMIWTKGCWTRKGR